MIKQSFLLELKKAISSSTYFQDQDFEIISNFKGNKYSLYIKYIYDSQYYIQFSIPDSKEEKYKEVSVAGVVCPGEIGMQERIVVEGKRGIIDAVISWLYRIREEIFSTPLKRELDEQKEQIEEILKSMNKLDDDYFSKEEAETLKEKLSLLEKDLKKQIKDTEQNEDAFKSKIANLENDIELLKATLITFKKRNWARSFAVRVTNWFSDSDNKQLLKSGIDLATKLLSDSNNNPNVA